MTPQKAPPPLARFSVFLPQTVEGRHWLIYNHEAFNGDIFLWYELQRLCMRQRIEAIVETGSADGRTTAAFAEMAPLVCGIEIDPNSHRLAVERLRAYPHVRLYHGDTLEHLPAVLQALTGQRLLLFLDAHTGGLRIPLLGELQVVAAAGLKPVIAIHDFKNPYHPEYRWDTYQETGEYCWELVQAAMDTIYGGPEHYRAFYNDLAGGARVGVLFVEPT